MLLKRVQSSMNAAVIHYLNMKNKKYYTFPCLFMFLGFFFILKLKLLECLKVDHVFLKQVVISKGYKPITIRSVNYWIFKKKTIHKRNKNKTKINQIAAKGDNQKHEKNSCEINIKYALKSVL